MVKIAASEQLKKVTGRILTISKLLIWSKQKLSMEFLSQKYSPNSKRAPNFSADIFARRGDFNATQDFIALLYFCQSLYFVYPPIISWDANVLGICLYFHESPIISWVANNLSRQYFVYSLIFWKGANILWICLILLLQIFVYIFSIYLCIWVCTNIFGAIVLTLGFRLIL